MHNPSAVTTTQESGSVFEFVAQMGGFAFNRAVQSINSNGLSFSRSDFLFFDSPVGLKTRKVNASLSLSSRSGFRSVWSEFNRTIRLHSERIPIGFASVQIGSGDNYGNNNIGSNDGNNTNGLRDDGCGVLVDDGVRLNGVEGGSPKRVLILMSDTGGGHRASAEAIRAAFNEEFGDDYQVFITDLWSEHTPWPFNQLPRSYNFLVKHEALWKMTYYGTAPRVIHQSNFAATSTFIARFHKLVTRCYCPSTDVSKRAMKAGLKPSQIKVYGLPVRPSFVKPVRPKGELRRELGMDEDLPAVLLMGGGEGMGPIEATARALADSLYDENLGKPKGQVLVICGRNKKLTNRLLSIDWKVPVKVEGFVTKMEECMGACDCIITKAGPGTIAEAMIRGLPIILNDYIAGQEVGNVPHVVENGCGKFSKSPKEIAKIVAEWFGPKADELRAMSQNALKLARPDSVFKIVHDLHELVRHRNFVPQYSCAT
ncbi:monogalactosyldiacylglycerol synthase, chloroplastic isoform X2 [Populus alba]|uniref:monogalactosyldiacylglycerol synthase, chloroplastic isoform X2 n=1 Tax=Populus alba TaxID=43335 RepID=UPI001589824E|nr:monogalactosyldiacylglycerol synthase, chloroplastic isoform X2 [Populus alba]